jgi:hypothetical protein
MKEVKIKRKGEVVMKNKDSKKVAVIGERPVPMRIPKSFRRLERAAKNEDNPKKPNGKLSNRNNAMMSILSGITTGGNPEFRPQHKKFKGYQRENRKYKKIS